MALRVLLASSLLSNILLACVVVLLWRTNQTRERFQIQTAGESQVLLLDKTSGQIWLELTSPGIQFAPVRRFDTVEELHAAQPRSAGPEKRGTEGN